MGVLISISTGLPIASFLADPFRDANNDGVNNALEYLFGPNGAKGTIPGRPEQYFMIENGGVGYYELSFVRPIGSDASYTPYYSRNLENWFVAPMVVVPFAGPAPGPNLQRVNLQFIYPITDKKMFFRVAGDLNPDNFDVGVIPQKPINWGSGLDFLDGVLRDDLGQDVDYTVEPGKELFFNLSGSTSSGSIYGGTAPNGVDRNFVYQDRSALRVAAVHAGVLANGGQGIVKVTFVETKQTPFLISTQNPGGNNEVTSMFAEPQGEPYSYRVERYSGDED